MLISILPLARPSRANLEPNAISRYCNTAIREVQQVFPLISSHPPPPSDNERSWSRHRARVRRGRGGMEHGMVGNVDGKGEVRECMGCWVEGGGWRAKDRSYAGVTGRGGRRGRQELRRVVAGEMCERTNGGCNRDVRGMRCLRVFQSRENGLGVIILLEIFSSVFYIRYGVGFTRFDFFGGLGW